VNIAKANPDLDKGSHIVVSSYNGVVLLAGQTPRADLKAWPSRPPPGPAGEEGPQRAAGDPPSSILARNNDAWLTTKIKTQMLTDANVPGSRIKVITENGIVYLLGLVTQKEANAATNVVQASRACRRSSSCSNTSTDPLPRGRTCAPPFNPEGNPHEQVLLPALLIGTFATLAGCSTPSVITLNDGRELQAVDTPHFDRDAGFYEFQQLDGKQHRVNKDQVQTISDL
jgi:hypothetical protein